MRYLKYLKQAIRRLLRMARLLATDKRVPRGVRPLIIFGLLPLPWILDELALITAAALLFFLRPGLLGTLWKQAGTPWSVPCKHGYYNYCAICGPQVRVTLVEP